jgi:vitamin B12 transporter
MQVDNWIIWLPNGNFWEPSNIREVQNSGVEVFLRAGQKLGSWDFGLEGDYTLARAINQTNIDENDRSAGKQLPYTPEHKAQVTARVGHGNLSAFINGSWVGQRFVATDNRSALGAYQLWNIGSRYAWSYWKMSGQLTMQVNNLMGENYEVLRLRPMPGRNYQINLSINI